MSRIDNLPDNDIPRRIGALTSLRDELRTGIQKFGSTSVKTYRIFSAATSDFHMTNVKFNNTVVEVTFTPSDLSNPKLGGVLFMRPILIDPAGGLSMIVERIVPVNGVSKWRIYLNGSDSFPDNNVDLKLYFYAVSYGTFSCALV